MKSDLARVASFSALAQAASFAKSVLIAYFFGVGTDVDGYYVGQTLPALAIGIFAGFLQSGFLPVYAQDVAQRNFRTASDLLGRTLVTFGAIGLAISLIIAFAAPWLIALTAHGASETVQAAAVASLRLLAFTLLLNGLADCLALALSVHGAFAVASLAPTVNAFLGSVLLATFGEWGLHALIWSTLVGVASQVLLVFWEIRRRKIAVSFTAGTSLSPVWVAGTAILPGLIFANLSFVLPPLIAASLGDGAVATFSIAFRLHSAAVQVFAIAASTVLLPHFALLKGQGRYQFIGEQLRRSSFAIAVIAIASVVMVGLAGKDVVSVLFERGEFDRHATIGVADTWFWLTIGLGPTVASVVLAKALQAFRMGAMMSAIALIALLITATSGVGLSQIAGLKGLAIAVGISAAFSAAANSYAVGQRLQQERVQLSRSTLSALAGVAILLTSVGVGCDFLLSGASPLSRIIVLSLTLAMTGGVLLSRIYKLPRLSNGALYNAKETTNPK